MVSLLEGSNDMKKSFSLKSVLFDPQVANANTAKREQIMAITVMLLMAVAALVLM